MLSALLARLRHLGDGENVEDEQLQMIPLLISAYPDLRPWLVRGAFLERNSEAQEDAGKQSSANYYRYLSLLLDVDEGTDSARFEQALVEVSYYCIRGRQ